MKIDIHAHTTRLMGPPRPNGDRFASPEELLAIMDRIGTTHAILLPITSPEGGHQPILTEETLLIAREYPDRFIPFCNVDPRADNNLPNAQLERMLAFYVEQGCRGLGEVTANIRFDDPRVDNLFAGCEKLGLSVTFHVGVPGAGYYGLIDDPGLPGLERALQRFPGVRFFGHSQPFWAEIGADCTPETRGGYPKGPVQPGRLVELFARYPNLYGDLSAGSGYNAVSRDPEFGAHFMETYQERLLFGLDICAVSNNTPLVEYLDTALADGRLSRQAYERITWRNADHLLGLGLADKEA